MIMRRFFLLSCCLLWLWGCNESEQTRWMDAARFISGSSPSQTLMYLDSIRYPHQLTAAQYAEYILLRAEAHDNLGERFLSDTSAIAATVAYYKKNKDASNILASLYYLGAAYAELPARREYAFFCFQEALEYAARSDNNLVLFKLHAGLGWLYQASFNRRQAVEHFSAATEYALQLSDDKQTAPILTRIGYCYFYLDQYDKAFDYFQQVRFMTGPDGDNKHEVLFGLCISALQLERWHVAKQMLFDAVSDTLPDNIFLAPEYLSLAYLYQQEGNIDSAAFYLPLADRYRGRFQSVDLDQQYHLMAAKIYRAQGDAENAWKEMQEALHSADRKVAAMDDNSRSETFVKFQNEKIQRDSDKFRISLYATNSFFGAIFLVMIGLWYLQRKKQNRQLQKAEASVVQLTGRLDSQESQSRKLKKLIMRDWELTKRIAFMEAQSSDNMTVFTEKLDRLVRVDDKNPFALDWPRFYSDIDDVFDSFAVRLRRHFPNLTEKERQLCCLTRAGFKTDEIALVWRQSVYSVQKCRSVIRKKLGVDEGGDIMAFILETMQ